MNFSEGQVSVVPATILDTDSDGIADFYDTDDDNDGVVDDSDAFPLMHRRHWIPTMMV